MPIIIGTSLALGRSFRLEGRWEHVAVDGGCPAEYECAAGIVGEFSFTLARFAGCEQVFVGMVSMAEISAGLRPSSSTAERGLCGGSSRRSSYRIFERV